MTKKERFQCELCAKRALYNLGQTKNEWIEAESSLFYEERKQHENLANMHLGYAQGVRDVLYILNYQGNKMDELEMQLGISGEEDIKKRIYKGKEGITHGREKNIKIS